MLAVYSISFHNAFAFDDSHTVVRNPAIRSLANIPRFFTDARTFSVNPANQGWRPLVSTSLAIDYAIGGGLVPWAFHLSTFLWFLVLLWCLYRLYHRALEGCAHRRETALFGACLFGLHPVAAETVNYIIQRADLYVALGCVAGVLLFARGSRFYLVPFVLAALCKPTALAFPLLLAGWLAIMERPQRLRGWLRLAPALAVGGLFGWLYHHMTPPTFHPGGGVAYNYWITQPYVALFTLGSFFAPVHLAVDTDWRPFASLADPRAVAGVVGVLLVVALVVWTARRERTRPIAFGLAWFLLGMVPTSVFPLAEVTNDHRMFLPLVGLALAGARAAAMLAPRRGRLVMAALVLVVLAGMTFRRNQVWHDAVSLWHDATLKSPDSGRVWMNYGEALMERGRMVKAMSCFRRALRLAPEYAYVHINMGVLLGATGHPKQAERQFREAVRLAPDQPQTLFFLARWLASTGRGRKAEPLLERALRLEPASLDAGYLLGRIRLQQADWPGLRRLLLRLRKVAPEDPRIHWLERRLAAGCRAEVETARGRVRKDPSADNLVALSFALWRAARYNDSLAAARRAVKSDPLDAEAYNNMAADYLALWQWARAARAAQHALRLQPDLAVARNNLRYAEARAAATRRRR